MRLPLNQQKLIKAIAKRQQRIEKEQHKYQQLMAEAESKQREQILLASALKNEVPMYEKAGLYSFISLNKQKRKQAIVLASLNIITTQLKEIEYQIEKLKKGSLKLQQERNDVIKKQNKMKLYFERKALEKELYIERLEQNEIQEMVLYDVHKDR
ncbi:MULTISPECIES: type III secretion protein [Proteus]|uniref:type III secretion protein n=1 Tax=Proteus TaxID=583 RepID=UPI000B4E1E7B|nr:type III secretion protein [Proteus terrae]MDY3696697.1 type III secretion protein [Proteus mirabilis]PNL49413.1 type III secretion protein [Proteus mirabilis]